MKIIRIIHILCLHNWVVILKVYCIIHSNGDCIPLLEINECLAEYFYTYNKINSPCKQAKDLNLELYIVIG